MAKGDVKISMKNGKVVLNRERLAQLFQNLKDGEYIVRIDGNYYKGRYAFYRGVLLEYILAELNLKVTNLQLHNYCKLKFCKVPIFNPMTGEIESLTGGSTTELDDDEFEIYKEEIRAHFSIEYEVEFTL